MNNQRLQLWPRPTAPAPAPAPLAMVTAVQPLPSIRPYDQAVVIIPHVPAAESAPLFVGPHFRPGELSRLILLGRTYHDQASPGQFVEKVIVGAYAYERREAWRTCHLAAAYAGAFGAAAVERPQFSYTEAVYLLGLHVGYDLRQEVTDPTGARGPLADRIIALTDRHYWTAQGVAIWLLNLENLGAQGRASLPGLSGAVTGRYNAAGLENG